jgi:hypothetical protein
MTGIITSSPPLVEQPPGQTSSNPAGLPGVTYTYALLQFAQTWSAKRTFPLGNISVNAADITGTIPAAQLPVLTGDVTTTLGSTVTAIGATKVTSAMLNADVFSTAHSWGGVQTFTSPIINGGPWGSVLTLDTRATALTTTVPAGVNIVITGMVHWFITLERREIAKHSLRLSLK